MITAAVVVITGFLRAGAAIVGWGNSFGEALASAGDWMLKAAIDWINGIITAANVVNDWLFSWVPKEIRDTLGLGQAGDMELIDYNDFIFRNTEATEENTKAVRDLQQELKNLPSGFRTSFYQYQSQAPRQNTSMVSGNNGAAYSEDISLIPDQRY
jgi:bifunctional DNA-binding transcriptional regulator/antitoxin component of YhaV-PrlF toxin-antitoxin module